jgi:hypothetical protein
MDHVKISNDPLAGLYAKTDPDCTFNSTRDKLLNMIPGFMIII